MSVRKMNSERLFSKEIPLAPHTTWRIGGAAAFYWEANIAELPQVLEFCKTKGMPYWYLGRGSNTLIPDKGLGGLVISTKRNLTGLSEKDGIIQAEGGASLPLLSKFAARLGYSGYEFLIGIPATIGGAIVMNAGLTAAGRQEIMDVLLDIDVVDERGNRFRRSTKELGLGYRQSNISRRRLFVASARFKPGILAAPEEIKRVTAAHLAERRRKQPLTKATAGSVFKQASDGTPAARYIEQAGLKGFRIGNAKVSEKHANWIENLGGASSNDVLSLIEHIREEVSRAYGILLETEITYLDPKSGEC